MEYTKIIHLIDDKTAERITKFSKNLQDNSETVSNENDKKIPKEKYIYPE